MCEPAHRHLYHLYQTLHNDGDFMLNTTFEHEVSVSGFEHTLILKAVLTHMRQSPPGSRRPPGR